MINGDSNKDKTKWKNVSYLGDIRLVRLIVQPLRVAKLYLTRCG